MSSSTRVLLLGPSGRMGRAITAAAGKDSSLTIVPGPARGESIEKRIGDGEVVIDFSSAEATEEVCRACAEQGKPLVLGTTGHSEAQKAAVAVAAEKMPIVFAANFSVGVNVLFALSQRAAKLLGEDFDFDLIELHHRGKKDAPSGTAKRLVEILQEARPDRMVAAQSVRAGDIVGEHTVFFTGPGERLELTHRASSRETFAVGALRAARWVLAQPPGLYRMEDVLGL